MPKITRAELAVIDWLSTELDEALGNWREYERQRDELQAMIKERRNRASRNRDVVSRANEASVNIPLQDLLDSIREWQTKARVVSNAILAKKAIVEARDWELLPDTPTGYNPSSSGGTKR